MWHYYKVKFAEWMNVGRREVVIFKVKRMDTTLCLEVIQQTENDKDNKDWDLSLKWYAAKRNRLRILQ